MELRYLNYDTTYSVKIGDRTFSFKHDACFSEIFKRISIPSDEICTYNIWINRLEDYVRKDSYNNYCFFTPEQLRNHINTVKRLFDFKSVVRTFDDHFDVTIKLQGPKIRHKYLLTWIRYAYEAPMNVMFVDINMLQKEKLFKFESKANLFLLLSYGNWPGYRKIHCVPDEKVGRFLKNLELQQRISECTLLNDIYTGRYDKGFNANPVCKTDFEEIINTYPKRRAIYTEVYLNYKNQ